MSRCAMVALLVLAAAACGSVGGGSKTGSGGTAVTTGWSGGSSASGGTGGSDAGAGSDARADAGPLPVSCQAIKQQNPTAASGVFAIAPLGTAQQSFCEMLSDGGGG